MAYRPAPNLPKDVVVVRYAPYRWSWRRARIEVALIAVALLVLHVVNPCATTSCERAKPGAYATCEWDAHPIGGSHSHWMSYIVGAEPACGKNVRLEFAGPLSPRRWDDEELESELSARTISDFVRNPSATWVLRVEPFWTAILALALAGLAAVLLGLLRPRFSFRLDRGANAFEVRRIGLRSRIIGRYELSRVAGARVERDPRKPSRARLVLQIGSETDPLTETMEPGRQHAAAAMTIEETLHDWFPTERS